MNAMICTRALRRATAPLLVFCLVALGTAPANAQPGHYRNVPTRNTTRTNFSGGGNVNYNRNMNVNRNTNVNVNRNTSVYVNNRGGYYGGCCYNHGPSVAGVVAASVASAAVVGAIVSTLPPSCTTIMANGVAYQNCGGTYYQPQYSGGNVQYIVVNQP